MRCSLLVLICTVASVGAFAPLTRVTLSTRHELRSSWHHNEKAVGRGPDTSSALFLATTASTKKDATPLRPFVSAGALVLLDVAFRRLLQSTITPFPSSLAGCGILLTAMFAQPRLYDTLQPGADLLAKWLPVFFVPSLITLPLADSLGTAAELLKVGVVLVGGFLGTLVSTAGVGQWVRGGTTSNSQSEELVENVVERAEAVAVAAVPSKPTKPFSATLLQRLSLGAALSGVASLQYPGLLQLPFMLQTTLATFVLGARLPKRFVKVCHPLITCTVLTWATLTAYAVAQGSYLRAMLRAYKTGSLFAGGAGDLLVFLLGPSVVSLSVSMYSRRKLMRENVQALTTAVAVSTVGGLGGTALAVRLLDLGNPLIRLSLLSRNITSPLAMAIAGILGADVSLAVSMVVISGLIGANFGASILDALGIKDAVARGLGIGAAAHGYVNPVLDRIEWYCWSSHALTCSP